MRWAARSLFTWKRSFIVKELNHTYSVGNAKTYVAYHAGRLLALRGVGSVLLLNYPYTLCGMHSLSAALQGEVT